MGLNCSGRFLTNKYTVCPLYICGYINWNFHLQLVEPEDVKPVTMERLPHSLYYSILCKRLEHLWISEHVEVPGTNPLKIPRDDCIWLIDRRTRILQGWKSWKLCLSQCISSVQCSCSVVSDFLWPHGLQHARLPCPSPTPRAYSNSCPSSRWCHPTISSVVPFSSCLQSFPASGSFPVSQFFTSGGQSIGVSVSASVLPMNIQGSFPLGWTGLISLQSKGLSRVFSNTTVQNINSLALSFLFIVQLSHPYMTTEKAITLTRRTFVGKVMSLLFNMLSRLVIAFLPRSKRLLISWLQSPSAVILEPKKINSATVSIVSPSIDHEVMGPDAVMLVFWML